MAAFLRFLLVGGAGYVVDVGLTYLFMSLVANPYVARLPAVLIAMVVTWAINRKFTYRSGSEASLRELMRYMAVASSVTTFNFLFYSLLVYLGWVPVLAITVATGLQAIVSFFLYKFLIFNGR